MKNKKKLALVNCYYGIIPNYFELWLQSCKCNPEIDFFFITDLEIPYPVPENVKVIFMTWEDLRQLIDSKFDFSISLGSPYKLTDFKPAYGYVFEDFFKSYDYWGYCDIDLIFGNLMKFIYEPMEEGYEAIYSLGHLTIYKNNEKMKKLFLQGDAAFSYKEVFSNPEYYSFDEHAGQKLIIKKQNILHYDKEDMADISCRNKRLIASRQKNYAEQVFYYENGSVFRSFIDNGKVYTDEFVYIHLQKRKYSFDNKSECFYIMSDYFETKEPGIPQKSEVMQKSEFKSRINDQLQIMNYYFKKIIKFTRCSVKQKIIWIKTKNAEMKF